MIMNFDYDLFGVIPVHVEAHFSSSTFALYDDPTMQIEDIYISYEGQDITDDIDNIGYIKTDKTEPVFNDIITRAYELYHDEAA